MRWTIRHYYNFGAEAQVVGADLTSRMAWDRLRLDTSLEGFALPRVRAEWLRQCEADDEAGRRADDVSRVITEGGHRGLVSIGVGLAHLEYWLKRKRPDVKLTCLEYGMRTVEILRALFPECDAIEPFDLRTGRWPTADPGTLFLFCRVDTELADEEWIAVFERMAEAAVRAVVFVPSGFLSTRTIARVALVRARGILAGRPATFAGYLRTKAALMHLWGAEFRVARELRVGDHPAFLLERRPGR